MRISSLLLCCAKNDKPACVVLRGKCSSVDEPIQGSTPALAIHGSLTTPSSKHSLIICSVGYDAHKSLKQNSTRLKPNVYLFPRLAYFEESVHPSMNPSRVQLRRSPSMAHSPHLPRSTR